MTVRDAAAWFGRGQQAMETGHLDEAIDSLRRATVRNRDDKRYVLTLAEALALKRDQEGAREMSEPIVPPAQQLRLRENRVSLILTIVIGVVCGLATVLFTVAIEQTSHLLFGPRHGCVSLPFLRS